MIKSKFEIVVNKNCMTYTILHIELHHLQTNLRKNGRSGENIHSKKIYLSKHKLWLFPVYLSEDLTLQLQCTSMLDAIFSLQQGMAQDNAFTDLGLLECCLDNIISIRILHDLI